MIIKKLKKKEGAGLCALFFLCVLCGLSFATTIDFFQSANRLYEQAKYEEAAAEYTKIIDSGYESGPLYYNLGNCYFKLGFLGRTILYYEKAKRLIPNDPELRFNYRYVESFLLDKISAPKRFMNIINLLTFGKWLGFIIIIWLILIITFIINKKWCLTPIFILVICIACAVTQYISLSSPAGILIAKEVPVRYGPGEGEVEAFLLHEGTKVEIKKTEGNWYQVQLPDGKSGWMPKQVVECI